MWHDRELTDVIAELGADPGAGISAAEAAARLKRFGPNLLPRGKKSAWWRFLLEQFASPLVYILLIAAGLTAFLREWIDTIVIMLAVAVNVGVGFWQEFHSQNILEKLRRVVPLSARVLRGGKEYEVSAAELVPGDSIVVKSGMRIPADARVAEAHNLKADEAILTGESVPVTKLPGTVGADAAVGDRTNMVHMGTVVERGEGTAVVVATGAATEVGKIALLTEKAGEGQTPLQERIGKLGRTLAVLFSIAAAIIFIIGLIEGHSLKEMFTTAIAVAVAAIPEGLPAAIAIVLAVSAQRIMRNKGVTKRLVAAETLGSASVICTDKTGTLTEGSMKVERIITDGDLSRVRRILAFANEALVETADGGVHVRGEVTDRAKMQAFLDAGGSYAAALDEMPRRAMIPFNPAYQYLASFHEERGQTTVFVSGSPEALLRRSGRIAKKNGAVPLDDGERRALTELYEGLAREGYRMIALAEAPVREEIGGVDVEDEAVRERLVADLTFAGFAALRDPIRTDVRASIAAAREAGITVIMLTGDHRLTAVAIGRELGFTADDGAVSDGAALDAMNNDELRERAPQLSIVARINPAHKLRIIQALQAHNLVVAMTGDGVNDAPALKAADIGIALGSGSDIAKEASDLILLDDGFSTIVAAIREGRIAFDNIRKVTVFLLVSSFTELLVVLSSLIFRTPLPITAVQILWTNLVEDTLPNIALSFEPGEGGVMRRPPIRRGEPILNPAAKAIIAVGIFTDLVLVGLFLGLYYFSSFSFEHIRTFMFAGIGLHFAVYAYAVKSWRSPIYKTNLADNPYLLAATAIGICLMLAALYVPVLNEVLETVPLGVRDWGILALLGILKLAGVELIKRRFFRTDASRVEGGAVY